MIRKKNKRQKTAVDTPDPSVLVSRIRKKYGLTLEELAHVGGWSFNTVHRWEKNKSRPHKNYYRKLLKIYEQGPESVRGE